MNGKKPQFKKALVFIAVILLIAILITFKKYHESQSHLPDFNAYTNTQVKKQAFFDYMANLDTQANQLVLNDRNKAIRLFSQSKLTATQRTWLTKLAKRYKLSNWNVNSEKDRKWLLKRVDEVPTPLLLAQAANESAWGTSRFAVEGNNLFGLWCFTKGCGMVPKKRTKGHIHEVMDFKTPLAAVNYYIYILNTNDNYQIFRDIRAKMRANGEPLDSKKLIEGLTAYSGDGQAYVSRIRDLIVNNNLETKYP